MLSQFISVLHKNTSSSKKNGSVKEKEKQDYVFCLKNAQKLGSHVLMVEDDTIPRPAILRVISKIVQTSSLENVAFIKVDYWFVISSHLKRKRFNSKTISKIKDIYKNFRPITANQNSNRCSSYFLHPCVEFIQLYSWLHQHELTDQLQTWLTIPNVLLIREKL